MPPSSTNAKKDVHVAKSKATSDEAFSNLNLNLDVAVPYRLVASRLFSVLIR
jgi:hypothetical protein